MKKPRRPGFGAQPHMRTKQRTPRKVEVCRGTASMEAAVPKPRTARLGGRGAGLRGPR